MQNQKFNMFWILFCSTLCFRMGIYVYPCHFPIGIPEALILTHLFLKILFMRQKYGVHRGQFENHIYFSREIYSFFYFGLLNLASQHFLFFKQQTYIICLNFLVRP